MTQSNSKPAEPATSGASDQNLPDPKTSDTADEATLDEASKDASENDHTVA